MNNLSFSIIIPYKGRFVFVKDAINSVLSQQGVSRKDYEILAIGDPEGDNETQKKLKKAFPGVKFLDNRDKEGPGGKRNTGLKYAKGKYVIFLDSDDQLKKNFLNEMRIALEINKNAGGVICLSNKLFEKGFPLRERLLRTVLCSIQDLGLLLVHTFNRDTFLASAYYLSQLSHMMFKRSAIGEIRFNYDYRKGGEDWDFCLRVLNRQPIKIVLKRLIYFRYSWGSSTYTVETMKSKWASYSLLNSRLPKKVKNSIFYKLFEIYIGIFNRK